MTRTVRIGDWEKQVDVLDESWKFWVGYEPKRKRSNFAIEKKGEPRVDGEALAWLDENLEPVAKRDSTYVLARQFGGFGASLTSNYFAIRHSQ